MRILVVDDEPDLVDSVRLGFELQWREIELLEAATGEAALDRVERDHPDIVLLDIGLPDIDGFEVLRQIRAFSDVPIVMLTARDDAMDKVKGLELGADDYMTKPFSPKELVARVRAVLRRAEGLAAPSDVIRVGSSVELDASRMEVRFDGRRVDLTRSEFQIVSAMARQPGRVFTRAQLLDAVRGVAFESYERAIDAHIKNIRRKIGAHYIETVFGVGYRFAEPEP